jgi:hypothetical protein
MVRLDAALDPTLWLKVLEDTTGFVLGSAAVLFWKRRPSFSQLRPEDWIACRSIPKDQR